VTAKSPQPDAIAEAARRIADLPGLEVERRDDAIEVAAPGPQGFPVALLREDSGFVVHYGGWHERFGAWRDAVNAFVYGLRGDCRLRVKLRGETACRWTLEHRRDGSWVAESAKSAVHLAFWQPRREVFLCNRSTDAR
jgi:hypothetical protein